MSTSLGTQSAQEDGYSGEDAVVDLSEVSKVRSASQEHSSQRDTLPEPSIQRREQSLQERPFAIHEINADGLPHEVGAAAEEPETVLYLAYGSNLCKETFLGKRKIRPLGAINVLVPDLILTFDLPGIPYTEPCFANTKYRRDIPLPSAESDERAPLLASNKLHCRNPQWSKGLVGVVYEVTLADFARIIATEGGGAAYQDILIDCYPLHKGTQQVPIQPDTQIFKTHTLYSPVYPSGKAPPGQDSRGRPDPDYAQPSARYLKLLTDGADEHCFPTDYRGYLQELKPYIPTSRRQKIGGIVFRGIWMPILTVVMSFNRIFADKRGRAPKWLSVITGGVFKGVWVSYDGFFRQIFGDGERTQKEERSGEKIV